MRDRSQLKSDVDIEPGGSPRFQYMYDERAADWRFLLPELPSGRALCLGGALSPVPLVLATTCREVVVQCAKDEATFLMARASDFGLSNLETVDLDGAIGRFNLVAGLRAAPGQPFSVASLKAAAEQVVEGGYLYLEIDQRAIWHPPALWRRSLRQLGFETVKCYWPKPDFRTCEMWLPLDDRRMQRYYLEQVFFASSGRRRWLKQALRATVSLGLFELTLPCYSLLARRRIG